MRTRKSYRRRAWAQRIALVLLLAVVATLIIARIEAEPVAGEVSTTPEATPQETAVLRPEPTYIVEAIPTPEPTPTVMARYADVSMTEAERAELAAIIYLEARGEPAEGQQAVAEVILNRVIPGLSGQRKRGAAPGRGKGGAAVLHHRPLAESGANPSPV